MFCSTPIGRWVARIPSYVNSDGSVLQWWRRPCTSFSQWRRLGEEESVCVQRRRNRQSYIVFNTCTVPENGPEPQRGGKKGLRLYRDDGSPPERWRTPEEFSRHLGHSQPKWRSAWMWRQCNARTRSPWAAEEHAGGRSELQQFSSACPEIDRWAATEKFPNPEEDTRTERWCHIAAILNRACPVFHNSAAACC